MVGFVIVLIVTTLGLIFNPEAPTDSALIYVPLILELKSTFLLMLLLTRPIQ